VKSTFPIIVQKFGGTTVGDEELFPHIITGIQKKLDQGYRVIVVVSAIGRKGSPYATDTLLDLLPEAHYVCRRERDYFMACGEVISAIIFASKLRKQNIPAIARFGMDAGIITDNEHGNARILYVNPSRLLADLTIFNVIVIAGFQGISLKGRITTLGRGGSDTSAVAIGAALKAERVEIYSDKKGIYTADPDIVPAALQLHKVNADDIKQMAWLGTKILHPRAAELALHHQVHVTVGQVNNPDTLTHVTPFVSVEAPAFITGIAQGESVTQISIPLDEKSYHQTATRIFEIVADSGCSMDMFTLTEYLVRFTVLSTETGTLNQILRAEGFEPQLKPDCKKVSIVGAGMHGMKGVMARFSRSLLSADIPLLQTVDSHATISGLVPGKKSGEAMKALHREFIEKEKLR